MRLPMYAIIFVSLLASISFGQANVRQPDEGLKSYTITIVEFRMKAPPDRSVTLAKIADDFDKLAAGGNVVVNETVRVSALENHPASAGFTKAISITTGVTQGVNGKTRSTMPRNLGTSLKVMTQSNQDKVFLKLNYQASRISGEAKEDTSPDIESFEVDTNLLLKPGVRTVVAGASSAESMLLLVTVTQ